MNHLDEIGRRHGSDKSSLHHDFLNLYEARLSQYVDRPIVLFEFGVYQGASARMWAEFFPKAIVVGIDIADLSVDVLGKQFKFRRGDQSDYMFLHQLVNEFDRPDIIIDDGSHRWDHQIATLQFMFPLLSTGGTYIIEDIDTSFQAYGADYAGFSKISAFDYVSQVARVVTAAGALGTEEPADLFSASMSGAIHSIEFGRRTCLIYKK